jgi:hypothetical protein
MPTRPASRSIAQHKEARVNKTVFACVFSVALSLPLAANAQDSLARFDGGIGSQPLRAGGLVNDVFGVPPGGQPWVISRLIADVTGRRIVVDGRGLILAGGNSIGTGGGQSVRARLFCGGVPHDSSALVPLEANGDFRIGSTLSPTPPRPCADPVLLIVSGGVAGSRPGFPGTSKAEQRFAQVR